MARTIWQTLQRVLVHLVTVRTFPALFADTSALDANPVTTAIWVRTVHWKINVPFLFTARTSRRSTAKDYNGVSIVILIYITFQTVFPLETERANAFAVRTVTVAVAVRHLAFVVSQVALFALPSRIALALAVNVLASLATQHRTNAYEWKLKIPVKRCRCACEGGCFEAHTVSCFDIFCMQL